MGRDKLRAHEEQQRARRDEAIAATRALIALGRFEEAENAMRAGDPTMQSHVTLARLYEERLKELVESGGTTTAAGRAAAEAVFMKAKEWSWRTYPDPHTAYDAEHYWTGHAADVARLVEMLGYEPGKG